MKKISIIGIGRLGICLALNLEAKGFEVLGVDKSEDYINSINNKTLVSYEPDVENMLKNSKNFKATNSLKEVLDFSNTIFVVVPTPSLPDGSYDHKYIENLTNDLKKIGFSEKAKKIIFCCTTMPGYLKTVSEKLKTLNYDVLYNPEFIAQGSIIKDQRYPDMILIGSENQEDTGELTDILASICENKPEIFTMDITSAEITKLALNCFITTKIAYANMVGDVCKKIGADESKVLQCIGADSRVGNKYLKYGFGFGGPCFPRDNKAFYTIADKNGINAVLSKSTDISNKLHLEYQVEDFLNKNKNLKNLIFGPISYKPNTTIIEESQQLAFAVKLSEHFNVTIKDSETNINQVKNIYGNKFEYIICS